MSPLQSRVLFVVRQATYTSKVAPFGATVETIHAIMFSGGRVPSIEAVGRVLRGLRAKGLVRATPLPADRRLMVWSAGPEKA